MDLKTAKLYVRLNQYKRLLKKTEIFIQDSLGRVRKPYVACSFGKDSSVMLHLILKFMPDIQVLWVTFPETKFLNNYYEIVKQWKDVFNINLKEIYVDVPATQDFDDKKAFPGKPYDSYFVGITKEESFARRVTIKHKGVFYKKKDGMIRIAPMADWKVKDIAAYCLSNNIPTLESYFSEGFESRTVTGFTEDIQAFRTNQLNELKKRDVASYNKMIFQDKGLKIYV